jgi:hypothetical protein
MQRQYNIHIAPATAVSCNSMDVSNNSMELSKSMNASKEHQQKHGRQQKNLSVGFLSGIFSPDRDDF